MGFFYKLSLEIPRICLTCMNRGKLVKKYFLSMHNDQEAVSVFDFFSCRTYGSVATEEPSFLFVFSNPSHNYKQAQTDSDRLDID